MVVPKTNSITIWFKSFKLNLGRSTKIVTIFVIIPNTSADELLYGLLTAVKYPFKDIVIEVNGKEIAMRYNTCIEILLCKNIFIICGEITTKMILAKTPNKPLKNTHFLMAILAPVSEFIASSSDTNLVAAKVIPELANVIHRKYIDITKPNIPIPSEPIILAKYISNNIPVERSTNETIVNIIVLITKTFNLFKLLLLMNKFIYFGKNSVIRNIILNWEVLCKG